MKKTAYLLSRKDDQSIAQLNSLLLKQVAAELLMSACKHFTINLFDDAVADAAPLRLQRQQPSIDAVLFVWFEDDAALAAVELALAAHATILSAYLLLEHTPIPTPNGLPQSNGMRTPGILQLAFLKVPERLQYDEWLSIWQNSHTQVAIDIQSTFIYRQNVVQSCLSDNDLGYSAIVEEAFPLEAMTSQHAFYAVQSDTQLAARQSAMWNSSKRFIDLSDLDVLPTSEYRW